MISTPSNRVSFDHQEETRTCFYHVALDPDVVVVARWRAIKADASCDMLQLMQKQSFHRHRHWWVVGVDSSNVLETRP